MFNQKSDEPLVRAKRGAVDAQRNLRCVLAGFVFKAEALGHGEVHLIGGDGKFTTGDAVDLHVDLRSVERRLVRHLLEVDAGFYEDVAHHVFGLLPQLRLVDVLVAKPIRAVGAEAHAVFLEAENLEVLQVHLVDGAKFVGELLWGAVDMRIVHLHRTHAHEAHQFAGTLIAVAGAVFGQAQWQLAVAARHGRENLVVMRAVHRLEINPVGRLVRIIVLHLHWRKHALGVVGEVS